MQVTIHGGEYNISAQGKLAKLLMVSLCDCVMAYLLCPLMVRYHIFLVVEKVGLKEALKMLCTSSNCRQPFSCNMKMVDFKYFRVLSVFL